MKTECMYGVPAVRGGCLIPNGSQAVQPLLVAENGDGTMNQVPDTRYYITGPRNAKSWWFADANSPYSFDAMLSAWAMLEEHDQRISDAGLVPSNTGRPTLWLSYYSLSKKQFADDDTRLAKGLPLQITYSADFIAPYPRQRLADIAVDESIGRIKDSDERALDEIIRVYGVSITAADISAKLSTNPLAARWVQMRLEQQLPGNRVIPLPSEDDGDNIVTGAAPPPAVGDISIGIKNDPSLPAGSSNTQSYDQALARAAREAKYLEALAPENYLIDAQAEAEQRAQLRDYYYWKANYPSVALRAAQNPGLYPEELNTPWPGPGLAPLVAVEITPRQRELPKKSFLAEFPIISQIVGIVALAIPVVGPILSAGLNYATNQLLQKWAKSWQPNRDEFAPQYYPQPFQVPMPLDRAQIMRGSPWYAPAMVDQFAEEVRVNQLRAASESFALLVDAMKNQPATASASATVQGDANQKLVSSSTTTNSASAGGALPLLAAGLLLFMGAPVVIPIGLVLLAGRKK